MKPFIKWAGGKRWLTSEASFEIPPFEGKYIEPFLGGGAVFFHLNPGRAILADVNKRLIETYQAIRDDWQSVLSTLYWMQEQHSKEFYYSERNRIRRSPCKKAAQFLYLNRTCWNGLYRENKLGKFNVPIGTKQKVIFEEEDFSEISRRLKLTELLVSDFETIIDLAKEGDLVFADPPYTTAHNKNGFIKYNQNIFKWEDQLRLKEAIKRASSRGANIVMTNANHHSIADLYSSLARPKNIARRSIIASQSEFRKKTSEAIYYIHGQ